MNIILTNPKEVGRGGYGSVYIGDYKGNKYAVKERYVDISKISIPSGCIHVNEISAICQLNHPNILLIDRLQNINPIPGLNKIGNKKVDKIFAIVEACDGDITDLKELEKEQVIDIMWQILSGLYYIHKNGFIHRDIKPSNILYKLVDGKYQIKICDFDMVIPDIKGLMMDKAMTILFMPPEILEQDEDVIYTNKIDVWGAGHILYYLLFSKYLFYISDDIKEEDEDNYMLECCKKNLPNGSTLKETNRSISVPEVELYTSDLDFDDLLSHMLDCDVNKRWSIIECMKHTIFSGREIPEYTINNSYILDSSYITDNMKKIFKDRLKKYNTQSNYGFFLGFDILMRVAKNYKGNDENLAICCYNIGMKYFDKIYAKCIPISKKSVDSIEYNIIAKKLKGSIYRDTLYNYLSSEPEKIFNYLCQVKDIKFEDALKELIKSN